MNIVLLPGASVHNKEWIDSISSALNGSFRSIKVLYYLHWRTGKEKMDFSLELNRLISIIGNDKEYCIFAKSAGILLALKGIREKKLFPRKCVFAGFPLYFALENNLSPEILLKNFSIPSIFIQKTSDPALSFNQLRDFLDASRVKNFSIIEIQGDNHNYSFDDVKEPILSFSI